HAGCRSERRRRSSRLAVETRDENLAGDTLQARAAKKLYAGEDSHETPAIETLDRGVGPDPGRGGAAGGPCGGKGGTGPREGGRQGDPRRGVGGVARDRRGPRRQPEGDRRRAEAAQKSQVLAEAEPLERQQHHGRRDEGAEGGQEPPVFDRLSGM